MGSQAVLRFQGSLEQGFSIILIVRDRQGREVAEVSGALPATPELAKHLATWQAHHRQGSDNSRITLESITVEAGSFAQLEACRDAGQQLRHRLTAWLGALAFQPVDRQLRETLVPSEATELIIRAEDRRLHQLPWHCWDVVERHPLVEVVFGSKPGPVPAQQSSNAKVRILSILGDSRNINTQEDCRILEALPDADVTFLPEPTRQEIDNSLWEQSWDILFFAGHSHSQDQQGYLSLNSEESLTIDELRYGLKQAIAHGLQLAIFNSCDGLGIAYELEQLHIPQLIVMREPVPDDVAQAFLKYFLRAYSGGKSLHLSLREARERLQSLEKEFPWATWLPALFQNPASQAPTWRQLQAAPPPSSALPAEPLLMPTPLLANLPAPLNPAISPQASLMTPAPLVQPAAPTGTSPSGTALLNTPPPDISPDKPKPNPRTLSPEKVQQFLRIMGLRLGLGLTVSLAVVGLRYSGLLQSAELALFDYFHRVQASEPEDDRILVVEIDEDTVREQAQLDPFERSLSDETLLELLTVLDRYEPAVIGLDFYRPEPTNLAPLAQQYTQNERIIGVCKHQDADSKIASGVGSPPQLPSERQSFSDIPLLEEEMLDEESSGNDRTARLQLLSADPPPGSPCSSYYSFSAAIAYEYLSAKGLEPDWESKPNTWLWGKAALEHIGASRFKPSAKTYGHYGPFANLKVAGHQLLLNYRLHQSRPGQPKSPTEAFPSLTLDQVLSGSLNKSAIQNKVIIIGVTASSSDDRWQTPFRNKEGNPLDIPGVYLQAQMTSQILSAVEQDRLIWRCLPWTIDGILVATVGLATALLLPAQRKGTAAIVMVSFTGLLYVTSAGVISLTGIYLPLVPALLAFGGASLGRLTQHQVALRQGQFMYPQLI